MLSLNESPWKTRTLYEAEDRMRPARREAQVDECESLRAIAADIRKHIITMIYSAGMGHMGGSLSSVEILVALYFHVMRYDPAHPAAPDRDRFILSKGHSVEGLYAILARAGYFPESVLSTYGTFGGILYGHPTLKVPGVEIPSGSLGHGLSVAAGMALAGKRDRSCWRVFVLMGDGEQAEGSVWEAAMAASHHGLDNLVAIVDCNGLQISGPVESVMNTSPLGDKYRSFGWEVREIDGHDLNSLTHALDATPWIQGKPSMILAKTVKGRGASFMENVAAWHHRTPTREEYEQAICELEESEDGAGNGGTGAMGITEPALRKVKSADPACFPGRIPVEASVNVFECPFSTHRGDETHE